MTETVVVQSLRVSRGSREVLQGVDFSLPAGQVTGLIGPSGCGKTTLIRALVGAQANVRGSVRVLGQPAGSAALRRSVAYMAQSPAVYADLSVSDNLRYFATLLRAESGRAGEVLHEVDLTAVAGQRVDSLSGGQRSRVSLAIALLSRPEVLILDEPTVGLDPVLRGQLWSLFRSLAGAGATLLVSSHVMDEAARCDRLLLMRAGRLVADASPEELLRRTGAKDVEGAFLALAKAQS